MFLLLSCGLESCFNVSCLKVQQWHNHAWLWWCSTVRVFRAGGSGGVRGGGCVADEKGEHKWVVLLS
ncbi:hypothetical protein A2U01_0056081, partial [Trifolium medium]|nr:hypothetical protein [Trifolium medium]